MRIFPLLFCLLLASSEVFSANLKKRDLFFISPLASPVDVASNGRIVWVAGGHGVLAYDGMSEKWIYGVPAPGEVQNLFYSSERRQLRVQTTQGVAEWNETFFDWIPTEHLVQRLDSSRLETEPGVPLPAPGDTP